MIEIESHYLVNSSVINYNRKYQLLLKLASKGATTKEIFARFPSIYQKDI